MTLDFKQELDVAYGVAQTRRPGLQRVLAENPGPFTYTGTGTYILGDDHVAVIDPGPDLDSHFDALMAALKGRQVNHILVTHTHLDHSPLAARLAGAMGAKTYGFGPHGSGREGGLAAEVVEAGADHDFSPDVVLDDGDVIAGGGWSLQAVHTPGHTSNHMCFLWREAKTLFSGDHVMGWSTTVVSPPDGDMRAYIDSLDRLAALQPSSLVPTHGPIVDDAVDHIRALKRHRLDREAQILAALGEGYGHIDDIVSNLYQHIEAWLHPAAARSVLSHLIDLVDRQAVITDRPVGLEAHYRLR